MNSDRIPVSRARTPNILLTAAAATGIPKYQLTCLFAELQSISYVAPSFTRVLYLLPDFLCPIRNWTPIMVFAIMRNTTAR